MPDTCGGSVLEAAAISTVAIAIVCIAFRFTNRSYNLPGLAQLAEGCTGPVSLLG